jgi:hypothetical protein
VIFQEELAKKVMAGEKTATRRRMVAGKPRSPWYRHGCGYKVGQVFTINPGRGIKNIGKARVTRVYSQPLGAMLEQHARQEGCKSLKHFRELWKSINKVWNPAERVWVVEFERLGAGES